MAGALKKYSFINAKLRTRMSKILSDDFFSRMIRAHSLQEAVQLLRDTDFAVVEDVYSKTGDIKTAELELLRQEIALYREVKSYLSGEVQAFVQALLLRYEIDNVKQAFRLWFDRVVRGREIDHITGYILRGTIVNNIPVDAIIRAETYDQVIAALETTPYVSLFADQKERVLREESTFPLEIALDRYFFRNLLDRVDDLDKRDREIARRMLGIEIDMQNINWLVRFKTFYDISSEIVLSSLIPGGRSLDTEILSTAYQKEDASEMVTQILNKGYPGFSSLVASKTTDVYSRLRLFESILREILSKEINHILSGYPFTIGTVLVYFLMKQRETQKILTVLNAKFYNMNEDRIESLI
jgi:V/A-type H+-transporting ATPase subunit C